MPAEEEPITNLRIAKWVGNITILSVAFVLAVYYACVQYSTPFSWHVILCTLGYIPIMAAAMVMFSSDQIMSQNSTRKTKYQVHGILLMVGFVLIVFGIAADSKLQEDWHLGHFTSAHAVTGLISAIFILISLLLGFSAVNPVPLQHIARPVWFKFLHNFTGLTGFAIGIVSLILGYFVPWFKFYASMAYIGVTTALTLYVTLWAMWFPVISLYHQFRAIIS